MINFIKELFKQNKKDKILTGLTLSPYCKKQMLVTPIHSLFAEGSEIRFYGCNRTAKNVSKNFPLDLLTIANYEVITKVKNCIAGRVYTDYRYTGKCVSDGVYKWFRVISQDKAIYLEGSIGKYKEACEMAFETTQAFKDVVITVVDITFNISEYCHE